MAASYAMVRARSTALALCALVLAGCGGRAPAAAPPAPSTAALLEAAGAEERARRYDRARALYQRAVDEAPDPASGAHAARELASALLFWGEDRDAERALERAARLEPDSPRTWHDLGVLRARRGAVADAEAALRRAARLAPQDPRPRVALAALLVDSRRLAEAERTYRDLLELELPPSIRRAIHRALDLIAAEGRP